MQQFLRKIWQGVPGNKAIVLMQGGKVKHRYIKDAESFSLSDADIANNDVYFAPAGFTGESRKADQVQGAAAFWLDIDCGEKKDYPSQGEAAAALAAWLTKRSFPAPSIVVSSGYGLHVYWLLKQSYAYDTWHRVAKKLKQATVVDQFRVDQSRTGDAASILRLPGSLNLKHGTAVPCTVLHDSDTRYTLHDIETALPSLGPQRTAPRPSLLPDDEDKPSHAPGDLEAVVAGCKQINSSWGKADIPEPLWRAALSVLSRCENGEAAALEYSRGDPRFDASETIAKAHSTVGPLSCEQFASASPGGCDGCGNRGLLRSPIQIRKIPAEPKPAKAVPVTDTPWPWPKVGKYVISTQGVAVEATKDELEENPDAAMRYISKTPIWVSKFRTAMRQDDDKPYAEIEISYFTSDGRRGSAIMEVGTLADKKKFEQDVLHMGVTGVMNFPKLKSFFHEYMDKHVSEIGTESGVRRLGWAPEGFVLGSRIVNESGEQPAKVISGSPIFKAFRPAGNLQGWIDAVETINDTRYLPLQATILAGFGSVLLELVGQQGAALVLTGESGGGKTTACKAAISIYGPALHLVQDAKQSTYKGLALTYSTARNIPVLVDEIGPLLTGNNAGRFGELIYLAANGNGGASSTRERTIRDMGNWYLQPMFTSNISVLDLTAKDLIQAHRNRIIELPVHLAMPAEEGRAFHEAENNPGHACVPYLAAVSRMKGDIKALFETTEAEVSKKYKLPPGARFCSWTIVAAMLGGAIAKSVGLISFDIDAVVEYMARQTSRQTNAIKSALDQVTEFIPEWLRQNSGHIIDIRSGGALDLAVPIRTPKVLLTVHHIVISFNEILQAIREEHISQATFIAWCEKHGCLINWQQISANTPKVKAVSVPYEVVAYS